MHRRQFLRTVGAAGVARPLLAGEAAGAAGAAPGALPYPALRRPFAMPGVKEQEWTGALFVGEGESRFALRAGLLTAQGRLIREKMTSYLWRIGPMTPDGA